MILNRVRGLNYLHVTLQAIGVVLLFWFWTLLVFGVFTHSPFVHYRYVEYSLVLGVVLILDSSRTRIRNLNLLDLNLLQNHNVTLRETLVMLGALLLLLVAGKDQTLSRIFLFSFVPVLYLFLFLTNKHWPLFLATFIFGGLHQEKTILLGSARSAGKLDAWLQKKAIYGFQVLGLVTDDAAEYAQAKIPILGGIERTKELLQKTNASQLVLLGMPERHSETVDFVNLCDHLGVRLLIVNDLQEKLNRPVSFTEDDGFNFMTFRQEPLECPARRTAKRLFDIAISLPVLIFILPWTSLIVWFLHRLQSPGPLFFAQKRTGRHHRQFMIYKYRTMNVGNPNEATQATARDPRIFKGGRWLRKLSIDELPQFINVLKGEMSIVGPRPHLLEHDVLFGEIANYYRIRSFIKPGITGLAQIRGLRGETRVEKDLVDRIQSDLFYLENWSIVLDSVIIAKTAWQMIAPPRTAY